MMRRHTFNLIEILMALGVLMIGVVSLIGLFPMASKVTADAALENTVPNTVEEFSAALRDLTSRPSGWKDWIGSSTNSTPLIPDVEPDGMLGFTDEGDYVDHILTVGNWTQVGGTTFPNLYKYTPPTLPAGLSSAKGIFMIISVRGADISTYKMSNDPDGEQIESRVLLTVWKSEIDRVLKPGADPTVYGDTKYGVRINMKVGWPAERPESEKRVEGGETEWVPLRKIKVMSFDLLNPDPKSVQ